jgi:hypothetical protein
MCTPFSFFFFFTPERIDPVEYSLVFFKGYLYRMSSNRSLARLCYDKTKRVEIAPVAVLHVDHSKFRSTAALSGKINLDPTIEGRGVLLADCAGRSSYPIEV